MKKYVLIMIALFTLGQMCKAQSTRLTSRQVLKAEKDTKPSGAKTPSPKKEDGVEQQYWVAGKAYFNEYGQFDINQLSDNNYRVNVTFNGEQVVIEGLINFDNFTITDQQPVTGVYNATNKTITIETPEFDGSSPISTYTPIGTISYFGDNVSLKLFAGNFSEESDENGQYALTTVSQLIFDVNDDLSVLTPRTGYGSYGFYASTGGQAGFLNFFKTAKFYKMTEEPQLLATDTVTFAGPSVTVGATLSKNIMLHNIGRNAIDYTVNILGTGLRLYASNNINGATSDTYRLEFQPSAEGDYTGQIIYMAANGSTVTTIVKAVVAAAPDFSPIVKNGDIVFSFSEDYPFAVTDTITGFPVAVSTNEETGYGTSTLNANITIPEGKTGILSWKGTSYSMQPNGAKVYADGDEIFNNIYWNNGVLGIDNVSNTVVFPSGEHNMSFINEIGVNWYLYGMSTKPFKSYYWDFDLQLMEDTENAAFQKENTADFGRHFLDKFAITDTFTVTLLNTGTLPLKVIGFRGNENFTGVIDNAEAEYTTALPVKLLFNATTINNYEGDVIINTTAGDFTVHCTASVEQIVYDYSPIVAQGEFSFNTSIDHPFYVAGDSAYSSIAYFDMKQNEKPVSWLEASFKIPENKVGVLSWFGDNSSDNYLIFMEDTTHNDGTIITIDGKIQKDYAGFMDASSTTFNESDLKFAAGLHKVNFFYRKIYSTVNNGSLDRFLIRNLSLILEETNGIEEVDNREKEIVRTEIFSASGERLNMTRKGINLVRVTYSDGTSITRKIVKK